MSRDPLWREVEAELLAQPGTDVDNWLDSVGTKLVNQTRPINKVVLWKALLAKAPAGRHDAVWQARFERFLDLAMTATRPAQVVRTLSLVGGSGFSQGPEALRSSLDYCLDWAQPGRQRRQVVRGSLSQAFHRMMYNSYKAPPQFEAMDVLLETEKREGLMMPWLLWWAHSRMYIGHGDWDDKLLARISAQVDLQACDTIELPVLSFLDSHSRMRAVHWAVDQLLRAGLDWTPYTSLSKDLSTFIEQHPVVRRERLGALTDIPSPHGARAPKM